MMKSLAIAVAVPMLWAASASAQSSGPGSFISGGLTRAPYPSYPSTGRVACGIAPCKSQPAKPIKQRKAKR
jgi:hypothetical protein